MDHDEESQARLERLAEAIADGDSVDWQAAEGGAPELRSQLDCLRTIESVSRLCQRVGDPAMSVDGPGAGKPDAGVHAAAQGLRTWGHHIVHERIGEGTFAEVYRATDPVLQRQVALKLFYAAASTTNGGTEALVDEARRLAQVRHPNVITVHGADVHAGRAGMWTELLHGETLEQSLQRRGTFSAEEATLIGTELCAAVAALHVDGLVHGDVTTRNVMRADGGRIVLMDFGAVREDVPEGGGGLRRCGTPLAMAPEVLAGGRPTRAGDVYQLGVLLYRLVCAAYPVEAGDLDTLVAKHGKREAAALRDRRPALPREFVQVVERALDPEPACRYPSMGAMERALRFSLGTERRARSRLRQRLGVGSLVAGVGVLATIAAMLAFGMLSSPLRVQTTLFRVHDGVPEPLDPNLGTALQAGDALFMTVESRDDVHLYVLNEASNELGVVNTLFPDPGLRLRNPLPGGRAHRLPAPTGGEAYWQASPTGGTEKILVVATRHRYDELEDTIAHQFHDVGAAATLDPERLDALARRAIELRRSTGAEGSELDRLVLGLEKERLRGDLWYQIIQVEPEASRALEVQR